MTTGLSLPGAARVADAYPWERPLGVRMLSDHQAEFRVWAPRPESLELRIGGEPVALNDAGYGVFETLATVDPGIDYAYVVNGYRVPDPCSRWQPEGLRGPSRVLDARALPGRDGGFAAPELRDAVIYELHIGTFTPEGTFAAAAAHLRE